MMLLKVWSIPAILAVAEELCPRGAGACVDIQAGNGRNGIAVSAASDEPAGTRARRGSQEAASCRPRAGARAPERRSEGPDAAAADAPIPTLSTVLAALGNALVSARAPGSAPRSNLCPDTMMTSQQLADELKRIATTQVSDITRAVKEGQKSIALNEVRDMARRLSLLADAFDPKSAPEEGSSRLDGAQAA